MSSEPRVLVSAFGPFDDVINASAEVLAEIRARRLGAQYRFALFECDGRTLGRQLQQAQARHEPDLWLLTGQARDRSELCLERFAYNQLDYRMADTRGWQPPLGPIVESGAASLSSTLQQPEVLVRSLQEHGFAARTSSDPGRYLCNHAFYLALHAQRERDVQVGFVHLPALPHQATPVGCSGQARERSADALCYLLQRALQGWSARC